MLTFELNLSGQLRYKHMEIGENVFFRRKRIYRETEPIKH